MPTNTPTVTHPTTAVLERPDSTLRRIRGGTSESDPTEGVETIRELGKDLGQQIDRAIDLLAETLEADPRPQVRRQAAMELHSLCDRFQPMTLRLYDVVGAALANEMSPLVRGALEQFGKVPDRDGGPREYTSPGTDAYPPEELAEYHRLTERELLQGLSPAESQRLEELEAILDDLDDSRPTAYSWREAHQRISEQLDRLTVEMMQLPR